MLRDKGVGLAHALRKSRAYIILDIMRHSQLTADVISVLLGFLDRCLQLRQGANSFSANDGNGESDGACMSPRHPIPTRKNGCDTC